jgi:hypothetical protein
MTSTNVTVLFLCISQAVIFVLSAQQNEDKFQVIKSPDNVTLCVTSPPTKVTSSRSKVDCTRQCLSQPNDRCAAVNYNTTTSKCSMYRTQQWEFAVLSNCQHLKVCCQYSCCMTQSQAEPLGHSLPVLALLAGL